MRRSLQIIWAFSPIVPGCADGCGAPRQIRTALAVGRGPVPRRVQMRNEELGMPVAEQSSSVIACPVGRRRGGYHPPAQDALNFRRFSANSLRISRRGGLRPPACRTTSEVGGRPRAAPTLTAPRFRLNAFRFRMHTVQKQGTHFAFPADRIVLFFIPRRPLPRGSAALPPPARGRPPCRRASWACRP